MPQKRLDDDLYVSTLENELDAAYATIRRLSKELNEAGERMLEAFEQKLALQLEIETLRGRDGAASK